MNMKEQQKQHTRDLALREAAAFVAAIRHADNKAERDAAEVIRVAKVFENYLDDP